MARMAILVPLVRTVLLVFVVLAVSLVLVESVEPQVLPAQLAPLGFVVSLERKAQSVPLDIQVLVETAALKVPLAILGLSDPVDLLVCQERTARTVSMASRVSLDLVEIMAHRVCVVSMAHLVLRA